MQEGRKMNDRYDRDRARDDHIRSEQRIEEQKRTEAYQKQRRQIEDGFRKLNAAGRDVERLSGNNPVHQAAQAVDSCEAEIDQLLEKLKALPDDPGHLFPRFFPGSNEDIRHKAQKWEELITGIRQTRKTDVWAAIERINSLRKEVDKYRIPSHSSKGYPFFEAQISDDIRSLLSKLGSNLLWLDQYYLELDHAKQK